MRHLIYSFLVLFLVFFSFGIVAQNIYFPPINSDVWEKTKLTEMGWCEKKVDSFYNYLDQDGTKSFILLKNGKIVLEKYFDDHAADKPWYWASAGKTMTAFMVGLAQEQGDLNIQEPTSKYLGEGWTSCTPAQEAKITIWNQLTMTAGLDDGVANSGCTDPSCLLYKADAGERWSYHNAPYTLLDDVLSKATGGTLNVFVQQNLRNSTGITGAFIKSGDNNVFWSNTRSFARFGLLMLNKCVWNNSPILNDTAYINALTRPSQNLNPSYGYLWWLNGQSKLMLPGSQLVLNRDLAPNAPKDMYCALGKNGQLLCVIPSENMVWVRMGESPDSVPVPFLLVDEIAQRIEGLVCTSSVEESSDFRAVELFPIPTSDVLNVYNSSSKSVKYSIYNINGQVILSGNFAHGNHTMDVSHWPIGTYYVEIENGESSSSQKIVISR